MEYFESKLENSVRLVVIPMPSTKTVTTLAMFGSGSRNELEEEHGLAHFAEHMFFKGSKKRPTTLDVAKTIDDIGGAFNAFTGKEHTGYYTKLPSAHKEIGFDFISDLVQNPLLAEEEITREKGVIIEEIHMYEDSPMRNVQELFDHAMWGKTTKMGRGIAGTVESVSALDREDLEGFINRNYVGSNMILAVAGDITLEEARVLAEKYFLSVKSGEVTAAESSVFAPMDERRIVKTKETEQSHFVVGFPLFSRRDKRKEVATTLATLLGGGMSSRLFISIRERQGLCYYIRCGVDLYDETGCFQVMAGVDNKRFGVAVKAVLKELENVLSSPIADEELKRAKEMQKGQMLIGLEDSENVANYYAEQLSLGVEVETPEDLERKIDAVSKEDLVALAKEVFDLDKLSIATVGPIKSEEVIKILERG